MNLNRSVSSSENQDSIRTSWKYRFNRFLVLALTFISYASFHMTRKVPSIVKPVLHPQASTGLPTYNAITNPGWMPFNADVDPVQVSKDGYVVTGSGVTDIDGTYLCTKFAPIPSSATGADAERICLEYTKRDSKTGSLNNGFFKLSLLVDKSLCTPISESLRSEMAKERFAFVRKTNKLLNTFAILEGTGVQKHVSSGLFEPKAHACWFIHGNSSDTSNPYYQKLCKTSTGKSNENCAIFFFFFNFEIPGESGASVNDNSDSNPSIWIPYDQSFLPRPQVIPNCTNGKILLGACDTIFLSFYAAFMFVTGHFADHSSSKTGFLGFGMFGSALFVALVGLAYYLENHSFLFFMVIYSLNGAFQSIGWPAVVGIVGKWYGTHERGLVMGIWNAHTSVGNILGSVIGTAALSFPLWTGELAQHGSAWPSAFIVTGFMMAVAALIVVIFLVADPRTIGLPGGELENTVEQDENRAALLQNEGDSSSELENCTDTTTLSNPSNASPPPPPCDSSANRAYSTFIQALCIPGVVEYSISLFFCKLVAYTFLFWTPYYLVHNGFSTSHAGYLCTFVDFGGIAGSIAAGYFSDKFRKPATVTFAFLLASIPGLLVYRIASVAVGDHLPPNILLMLMVGSLINAPYSLITTAISADLGSQKALKGKANADLMSTVSGIIDGTGSIGAALQG
eukprot:g403.t1